ncbi:MAG TPA: hypothetical protein PLJ26_00820 [Candidatus Omnitrophota bacterium]|nr:hypothetical protein [Candidatus Omnitrophota bacterium]HQJ15016.1 hypothetical protein [Candidatus Omnitrophota bacterium]
MRQAIFAAFFCLAMPAAACCHQPRISFGQRHPFLRPVVIRQPEVSRAYYGILEGEPDYYRIDSGSPYQLYLNILVPDRKDSVLDVKVDVVTGNLTLLSLKGAGFGWTRFFEPFARDRYLKGPELDWRLRQGTYFIKVSNRGNRGRYVLAVGRRESFPVHEVARMAWTLPVIKKHFFGKPGYCAFFSPAGLIVLGYMTVICGIVWGAVIVIRRYASK